VTCLNQSPAVRGDLAGLGQHQRLPLKSGEGSPPVTRTDGHEIPSLTARDMPRRRSAMPSRGFEDS
jgi:hypothetical protein